MKVAKEKKKNNIAEYVLYMWQLEDLIRAFNFDIAALEKNVFGIFSKNETEKQVITDWYLALVEMMGL